MGEERVQKILASAGYGSRRSCEQLIDQGRIKVNGRVIQLGAKADPEIDKIEVDGKKIRSSQNKIYIALNKPKGVLSDFDKNFPQPNIFELVTVSEHLFTVGRLDKNSEGLILLTNDGELANRLSHPRYTHEKEYEVLVIKDPDEEQLKIWSRGVVLEDGYKTLPVDIEILSRTKNGTWLRIIMREGKKRQIRKTGARIGLPVTKLRRMRIGTLKLGDLKSGQWRYLTEKEVTVLRNYAGLK